MILDSLLVNIKSELDDSGFEKLFANEKKTSIFSSKIAKALSFTAVGLAIDNVTKKYDNMLFLSDHYNTNLEEMQKITSAGDLIIGTNSKQVENDLTSIQERIAKIQSGTGDYMVGVIINQDSTLDNTIEQLRELTKGMDTARASFFLERNNIPTTLLPILRKSREEMEKMSSTNILKKEDLDKIKKLSEGFGIFKREIGLVKDNLIGSFAPALTMTFSSIGGSLATTITALKPLFRGMDLLLTHGIGLVTNTISGLADGLKFLSNEISLSENGMKILIGAGVLMAAAWSPVLLTLAAIEEIIMTIQGKDTLLSEYFGAKKSNLSDEEAKAKAPQVLDYLMNGGDVNNYGMSVPANDFRTTNNSDSKNYTTNSKTQNNTFNVNITGADTQNAGQMASSIEREFMKLGSRFAN